MVSVGGSSTFIGIVDHKVLIRLLAITVLIVVSLQLFVVRRAGPLPLLSLPGTEGTSLKTSQLLTRLGGALHFAGFGVEN